MLPFGQVDPVRPCIASRYHIEFGEAKSKILKIGKGQHQPDMFLGNMKLEYTNTYKYLGETLNHKGNMENHIPEIKRKTESAYTKPSSQFSATNTLITYKWKLHGS